MDIGGIHSQQDGVVNAGLCFRKWFAEPATDLLEKSQISWTWFDSLFLPDSQCVSQNEVPSAIILVLAKGQPFRANPKVKGVVPRMYALTVVLVRSGEVLSSVWRVVRQDERGKITP